jgi:hypothetical protein
VRPLDGTCSSLSGTLPVLTPFPGVEARAIYDYTAGSPIEADLAAGWTYQVADRSDAGWWKVELADGSGKVANVPASYLEVDEAGSSGP